MAHHSYPAELAKFVSENWNREDLTPGSKQGGENPATLIDCGTNLAFLEPLISGCYQASLLREELRPVMLRAICCQPTCFPLSQNPPAGFHILQFDTPRKFEPKELRVLSQAANFYRSLIGIGVNAAGELQIWGIVHSGPRWLRELQGGRKGSASLPPSVVIRVNAPGHLEVCRGSTLIGQLRDGRVSDGSMNVFESKWLPDCFGSVREELQALHEQSRADKGSRWAHVDPAVAKVLGQQMVKRLIAAVQAAHHGGMLVVVPPADAELLLKDNPYLHIKYKFLATEVSSRYGTLILAIMERLAAIGFPGSGRDGLVGWREYEMATDDVLLSLDEALFEMSYLVAGLTGVDGAVVMTKRFEILGFGAEISSSSADIAEVARAVDIEGEQTIKEDIDGFGTRHRSAYRFAHQMPDSVTLVVSQDGGVQFVKRQETMVTYWNHGPSM